MLLPCMCFWIWPTVWLVTAARGTSTCSLTGGRSCRTPWEKLGGDPRGERMGGSGSKLGSLEASSCGFDTSGPPKYLFSPAQRGKCRRPVECGRQILDPLCILDDADVPTLKAQEGRWDSPPQKWLTRLTQGQWWTLNHVQLLSLPFLSVIVTACEINVLGDDIPHVEMTRTACHMH